MDMSRPFSKITCALKLDGLPKSLMNTSGKPGKASCWCVCVCGKGLNTD